MELETNTNLVKQALWCFGNMAAMYGTLNKVHDEDEFMILDGICDTVIKLAME